MFFFIELPDRTPPSPPAARERFSYTRYQLELLNVIYEKIRYPNTMQKQLIAKRVGITRDQVKVRTNFTEFKERLLYATVKKKKTRRLKTFM